jgi:hypothetical protein
MKTNKLSQLNQARVYADGLDKHYSKSETVPIDGTPHKASDLAARFRNQEALVTKTMVARAEWLKVAADAEAADQELQPLVKGVAAHVRANFGVGSTAYNDFGLQERKVAKKSATTKAQAAVKAVQTREARHPREAAPAEPAPAPPPAGGGNGTPGAPR